MRKKIYRVVHVYQGRLSSAMYKWFMIFVTILSLVPLMFKGTNNVFTALEHVCLLVYIVDYFLRWLSADYKFNNHAWTAFAKYPFRLVSIIDLMAVISLACPLFGWFESNSFTEVLKVFRIVRILRYSQNIRLIIDVLRKSKKSLIAVGTMAVGYVLISSLIVFNVEPQSFDNFFEAIYWATITLTTVGYGDIYPITTVGKVIAVLSSFFGVAVVALPAGIVTAEYMKIVYKKEE